MFLQQFVKLAIKEDVGDGDHSSLACIPEDAEGEAQLLVKDNGVIAGIDVAKAIFHHIDPELEFRQLLSDGNSVEEGNIAFFIQGKDRSILKAERLVLNIMQRMSGIATLTNQVVESLEGTNTKVLDTRKTTPLLRFLEKDAVRIGGGTNHRMGLYDMIMLKDNHIDYAGGITKAIQATNAYLQSNNLTLKVIVEARDLSEVEEILANTGVHRVLCDNFSYDDLTKAVEQVGKSIETEASGGITAENARNYADCGVDYISMGQITHSVTNFDLSLKAT